jgi:hypothetical protein
MTLRLTDDEQAALRETAEREHRSMQEVAKEAIRAIHRSGPAAETPCWRRS